MFTVEENKTKARLCKRKVSFTLTVRTHLKSLLLGIKMVCDCCLRLDVSLFSVVLMCSQCGMGIRSLLI